MYLYSCSFWRGYIIPTHYIVAQTRNTHIAIFYLQQGQNILLCLDRNRCYKIYICNLQSSVFLQQQLIRNLENKFLLRNEMLYERLIRDEVSFDKNKVDWCTCCGIFWQSTSLPFIQKTYTIVLMKMRIPNHHHTNSYRK